MLKAQNSGRSLQAAFLRHAAAQRLQLGIVARRGPSDPLSDKGFRHEGPGLHLRWLGNWARPKSRVGSRCQTMQLQRYSAFNTFGNKTFNDVSELEAPIANQRAAPHSTAPSMIPSARQRGLQQQRGCVERAASRIAWTVGRVSDSWNACSNVELAKDTKFHQWSMECLQQKPASHKLKFPRRLSLRQ